MSARRQLLVVGGALCGFAWGHQGFTWLIGLAALMPLLWHWSASRRWSGATVLAYYLVAGRRLPLGAGIFFAESASAWFSWALWLIASAINALPWFLLWSQNPRRQAWTMPAALALTAAGVVFPGLGFVGLALLVIGLVAVVLSRWAVAAVVTIQI